MSTENLDRLFAAANKFDASDLHLVAGVPPAYRVNGEIIIADGDALTQHVAALRACGELSKAMLELLVLGDADRSSRFGRRHRAPTALRAARTGFWIEFDNGAWLEVFDLAGRAANGAVAHVDDEVSLAKQLSVAGDPGLAQDFAATREHILHEHTADVAAVDVKRSNL